MKIILNNSQEIYIVFEDLGDGSITAHYFNDEKSAEIFQQILEYRGESAFCYEVNNPVLDVSNIECTNIRQYVSERSIPERHRKKIEELVQQLDEPDNYTLKPRKFEVLTAELYNPNCENIGVVNIFEFNDFRFQCRQAKVAGYYIITDEGYKVVINADGRLQEFRDGKLHNNIRNTLFLSLFVDQMKQLF